MNYLVLGGDGFQGYHLCRRLLENGNAVRVFDRNSINKNRLAEAGGRLDWIEGDFSDYPLLEKAVSDVDIVFHLISTTLPKTSNDNPIYDVESNVVPFLALMEKIRGNGVRKIIFFSSGGTVYGMPNAIPIPEDHPANPICAYGIHKLTIEKYLHMYHALYGLDYAVMRIANPYGMNQQLDRGQGVIPVFLNKMLRGEPLEVWGDGSVVRDYVYIEDIIDAAVGLVNHQGSHRVFNIGSGLGTSLIDLISLMGQRLNCSPEVHFKPARPLDVPVNILDIERAKHKLGWEPRTSLVDGIDLLIRRIQAQDTAALRPDATR